MAKWGEGDPRWIVEDRADGTNVNNWHWTEKDATEWSKQKLKSLLQGLKVESDQYTCEVKEVTKCDGDASASNRKGKLIFFYEWVVTADWEGQLKDSETKYKGKLEIPNLSDENTAEEVNVDVSVVSDKDEAYKIKEFMRLTGAKAVQGKMGEYITDLKEKYSEGMILPTRANGSNKTEAKPSLQRNKPDSSQPSVSKAADTGVKIECRTLTDKVEFKCRVAELYRALTEKEMVQAFTRGPVQINPIKGGRFALFDGNITGEFTQLDLDKKIAMRWQLC